MIKQYNELSFMTYYNNSIIMFIISYVYINYKHEKVYFVFLYSFDLNFSDSYIYGINLSIAALQN
jgi:hypothetical protein